MRNASIRGRKECIPVKGIAEPFRILHISDVHFSELTAHEENLHVIAQILEQVKGFRHPHLIAVTGDLVSRVPGEYGIPDAVTLMTALRNTAPVVFALGNHEFDLPEGQQDTLLTLLRNAGVLVLDNALEIISGMTFAGLTLPGTAYRNHNGSYSRLTPVTPALISECMGECPSHPCVLLAHSPMGFPAYAEWGADVVLSGHVHGGIVRIGNIGILSPERKFLPKYTKGIYQLPDCVMNVSAGVGKLRINNMAEVVCIDLIPSQKGGVYENSGVN